MHAWKSKQTKKISNASSFTHPPSLRSLALFLLFSTFFSLRSAPFPCSATCDWSSLLLKLFFFPPSSLYDLLEGGKERGGLEGSSHSKLERKGLRRVTAPRGAPPPVKAARRPGERRAAAAAAGRLGAPALDGRRRGSPAAASRLPVEAKGQAAWVCVQLLQGCCSQTGRAPYSSGAGGGGGKVSSLSGMYPQNSR